MTEQTNTPQNFDGISDSDINIPFTRIVQPLSKEGEAGTFYDPQTKESRKEINDLRIVKVEYGQVLLKKFPQIGRLCWSSNTVRPDKDVPPDTQGCLTCEACPLKNFTEDKTGKKIAPECKETITIMGLEGKDGMPFKMSFKSTQLTSVRALISRLAIAKNIAAMNGEKVSAIDFAVSIKLQLVNASSKYYIPVFSAPKRVMTTETTKPASLSEGLDITPKKQIEELPF